MWSSDPSCAVTCTKEVNVSLLIISSSSTQQPPNGVSRCRLALCSYCMARPTRGFADECVLKYRFSTSWCAAYQTVSTISLALQACGRKYAEWVGSNDCERSLVRASGQVEDMKVGMRLYYTMKLRTSGRGGQHRAGALKAHGIIR